MPRPGGSRATKPSDKRQAAGAQATTDSKAAGARGTVGSNEAPLVSTDDSKRHQCKGCSRSDQRSNTALAALPGRCLARSGLPRTQQCRGRTQTRRNQSTSSVSSRREPPGTSVSVVKREPGGSRATKPSDKRQAAGAQATTDSKAAGARGTVGSNEAPLVSTDDSKRHQCKGCSRSDQRSNTALAALPGRCLARSGLPRTQQCRGRTQTRRNQSTSSVSSRREPPGTSVSVVKREGACVAGINCSPVAVGPPNRRTNGKQLEHRPLQIPRRQEQEERWGATKPPSSAPTIQNGTNARAAPGQTRGATRPWQHSLVGAWPGAACPERSNAAAGHKRGAISPPRPSRPAVSHPALASAS
ncbi:hypothetical protein NDU88_005145 [Pleurodeles waltl]|uniref:Uncharacterized protein n=1 Tax=Pleurodeles waltl TaxID=8319 RepID=A0AAV7NRE2_PLEWA|nr:hypothetical protein NDU88_005145 [Pleurodeles waltl]